MPDEGLPPSKQQQSEESLPALDDEERKAVQTRARERLQARAGGSPNGLTPKSGSKTPKSGSSRVPGYMTPKSGGKSARKAGNQSSRSTMLTNRTSSPTGRYHPDPERRLDIRKVRARRPVHPSSRAPPRPRRQGYTPPLRFGPHARAPSPSAEPPPPLCPDRRRRTCTRTSITSRHTAHPTTTGRPRRAAGSSRRPSSRVCATIQRGSNRSTRTTTRRRIRATRTASRRTRWSTWRRICARALRLPPSTPSGATISCRASGCPRSLTRWRGTWPKCGSASSAEPGVAGRAGDKGRARRSGPLASWPTPRRGGEAERRRRRRERWRLPCVAG